MCSPTVYLWSDNATTRISSQIFGTTSPSPGTVQRGTSSGQDLQPSILGALPQLNALASVIAPNGDLIVAGERLDGSGLIYKPILARFTSAGDLVRIRMYTDPADPEADFIPSDLISTSDGNSALVAATDDHEAHLLKFDDLVDPLWARRLRREEWDLVARSLIEDSAGRLVIAGGCLDLNGWGGPLLARVDLDGTLIDAVAMGDLTLPYSITQPYIATGQELVEREGQG